MRRAVIMGGAVVGIGVALQLALTLVALVADHVESLKAGSLPGDAGFFAAFLGLALVPFALVLVVLACIGRWIRAAQDRVFFTRAIWAAIAMTIVASALLLAGIGTLGGGIIPH